MKTETLFGGYSVGEGESTPNHGMGASWTTARLAFREEMQRPRNIEGYEEAKRKRLRGL